MRFDFLKLAGAIAVAELAGVLGAFFTTPAIQSGWYAALARPALDPPAWVFAPVWTVLYALMGVSLFLVWQQRSHILTPSQRAAGGHGEDARMLRMWRVGIAAFFIQLFLNAIWSFIFFGLRSPGWALVDIAALWFAIIWTMVVFYRISKPAAYLLVPYLLWVSFASYLNYSVWILN